MTFPEADVRRELKRCDAHQLGRVLAHEEGNPTVDPYRKLTKTRLVDAVLGYASEIRKDDGGWWLTGDGKFKLLLPKR